MTMRRPILLLFLLFAFGCRGQVSDKPPIHLNPNMDSQERFDPQEANPFFADGRAGRPPVPGTVARGSLRADPIYYTGKNIDGTFVSDFPRPVTSELLKRGRERFDIYCATCHDRVGSGQGLAVKYSLVGFPPPPSFHEDRIRDYLDGQFYDVITHGIRTMPSYASQINVDDRWAIIAYIRALQRSQRTTRADVPPDTLDGLVNR